MAEYIDRERARNEFAVYFRDSKKLVDECDDLLCYLPTADVVEVVRCKDCESYINGVCHKSEQRYTWVDTDHYCGYGKRKESADNG